MLYIVRALPFHDVCELAHTSPETCLLKISPNEDRWLGQDDDRRRLPITSAQRRPIQSHPDPLAKYERFQLGR